MLSQIFTIKRKQWQRFHDKKKISQFLTKLFGLYQLQLK